ncbi:hypothetical protein PRIPAC_84678 [Pristionchus pacificus]|uniref:Uncharacterized protein n=1 Tax=Pristionchus pacificus TaxID=54126 RepID=A0A2A6BUR6_PRIPA|nr:hypothetical protein PRIPAC_84678 [Pristionchus pacificus]|eukprot:PDM69664.1 hypothetical protein PRIPAC_44760 [Pristionchus pacificus]
MMLKVTVLLVCLAACLAAPQAMEQTLYSTLPSMYKSVAEAYRSRSTTSTIPDYLKEMEQPMLKTAAILRKSLALIEDGYKQTFKKDMPKETYDDSTEFPRNLANLAYWQVVRTSEGYDEETVNANRGEVELLRIAKYLSGAH